MKYKVSNLLNQIPVQDVELENSTPLSSERIKEITMKKVNGTYKRKRSFGFKFLVAAAIVVSLTVTAFAAEQIFGAGDIFRDALNIQLEKDRLEAELDGIDGAYQDAVSENQVNVVNKLGKVFEEQTYTDQGTTITATAAYSDEYRLYLYLSVTAPDGTVLPDDVRYTFYDYNDLEDHGALGGNAPYDAKYMSIEIAPMPDEVPTDNCKDFVVTISAQPGGETKFNDGYTKFLSIQGIYQQIADVNDDEDGYELLAPGEFLIDLTLSHDVEAVELDVGGLTYGGEKTRTWTHDSPCQSFCDEDLTGETDPETGLPIHSETWEYSVTAESFQITPMSVTWECSYEVSDEQRNCGLDFRVVMKDGTSPMTTGIGGDMYGDGRSRGTAYFTVPISLEDIDYILIGDPQVGETHKLYLPESD